VIWARPTPPEVRARDCCSLVPPLCSRMQRVHLYTPLPPFVAPSLCALCFPFFSFFLKGAVAAVVPPSRFAHTEIGPPGCHFLGRNLGIRGFGIFGGKRPARVRRTTVFLGSTKAPEGGSSSPLLFAPCCAPLARALSIQHRGDDRWTKTKGHTVTFCAFIVARRAVGFFVQARGHPIKKQLVIVSQREWQSTS